MAVCTLTRGRNDLYPEHRNGMGSGIVSVPITSDASRMTEDVLVTSSSACHGQKCGVLALAVTRSKSLDPSSYSLHHLM
jgi:hypothetical protein